MTNSVEERAERLRVLLSVGPCARSDADLSYEDEHALEGLTQEDLHLANACFQVEAEIRSRQFLAVEELAAAVGGRAEVTVEDRVCALPDPEFNSAARLAIALGWVGDE